MNWQEIKEKYPMAYTMLKVNYDLYEGMDFLDKIYLREECCLAEDDLKCGYDERDLFDFFDDKKILIGIQPDTGRGEQWGYWIDIIDEPTYYQEGFSATRRESEEQAFLKAFHILEGKL